MDARRRTIIAYAARVALAIVVITLAGIVGSVMSDDPVGAGLSAFMLVGIGGFAIGMLDGWWGRLRSPYAAWLVLAVSAAAVQQLGLSLMQLQAEGGPIDLGIVAADVLFITPFTAFVLYCGVAIGLPVGGALPARAVSRVAQQREG